MHSVPSLIGSGASIAAAATGLVFGFPHDNTTTTTTTHSSTSRSKHSRRRSLPAERRGTHNSPVNSTPPSRSGTVSATATLAIDDPRSTLPRPKSRSRPPLSRYQRPHTAQHSRPNSAFEPQYNSTTPSPTEPAPPESIPSSGSWVRRLSLRPLSQHGSSTRSSIIPDHHSSTPSHGSSAPILRPRTSGANQLPPNKLVKRSSSKQSKDAHGLSRSKSKGHLPTLRRPATSHQRSATLQQYDFTLTEPERSQQKFSFDALSSHRLSNPILLEQFGESTEATGWLSYFHSKLSNVVIASLAVDSEKYGNARSASTLKRSDVDPSSPHLVHLIKPIMLSSDSQPDFHPLSYGDIAEEEDVPQQRQQEQQLSQNQNQKQQPEPESLQDLKRGQMLANKTPEPTHQDPVVVTRIRRSLSSSFAFAAGSWVSKTSGSLRRPRRGTGHAASGGHRHVSAPITTSSRPPVGRYDAPDQPTSPLIMHPLVANPANPQPLARSAATGTAAAAASGAAAVPTLQQPSHKRHLSSPLPPLSQLSSFHVDSSQPGSAGGVFSNPPRQNQPSGSSTSSAAMSQLRSPHYDRASALEGLDSEGRSGFISGDDDDTDFKSDTLYDSLRTVASSRARAVETPLESVYDESPPSTAEHTKANRRLSIHEMLGKTWSDEVKIDEEDEPSHTPSRSSRSQPDPAATHFDVTHELLRLNLQSSPRYHRDVVRPSMDESDDDWARDDSEGDDDFDAHFNPLSPPSKGSSVNSRGVNPNVRLALANIAGNSVLDPGNAADTTSDRPLSSLFDWSEQTAQDKHEAERRSGRPQTAYPLQAAAMSRGGRPTARKTPHPTHVRSQSVPVNQDASGENAVPNAKYGTWGISTKTVSEDWDEDFVFGADDEIEDDEHDNEDVFAVPESIRASQLSIRAHSGQIRELSLLVNDLKRLCGRARELDLLDGPQKELWTEAEGVIALASPDDDELESTVRGDLESSKSQQKFFDDDFDVASLDKLDINSPSLQPAMSKTAVVRERHSPRRRSVFSPDDDIFGGSASSTDDSASVHTAYETRPRTPDNHRKHVNGVVRTVMEAVQQRTANAPTGDGVPSRKMQFDTNSLKVLVRRSGELRDALSDIIRGADQLTESPLRPKRQERGLDSSPAFTRVFDEPGSSPPRHVVRSRGNNSVLEEGTPENSPRQLGRRFPLMTVS